jgi:RNA polymerase sigma-32 factor
MTKTPGNKKPKGRAAKPKTSKAIAAKALKTATARAKKAEILPSQRLAPQEPDEQDADLDSHDDSVRAVQAEIVERGEGGFDPGYAGDLEFEPDAETEDVPALPASRSAASRALAPSDPIALYLAELRRYPLLTREQEQELAVRYRETGDPKAAEMLVTSNLRFVVKIAAEYSKFGAKLIDLVQEGNVGLMHAVKEFNPYKGVRLITYAVWWIRGYIQEYLMRQYSMVRIGTTQNQRKLFYRLQKERDRLDQMGQEPNFKLLAGRLGVTEEEVETMSKRLKGRDVSLSQPIDSESSVSLLDFETTGEAPIDEQLGHLEEVEVLKKNLEHLRPQLSEKELYILEHRMLSHEPMTLQEIGEHYGVTREAVRQLEARLMGKIRDLVEESLKIDKDPDGET